MRYIGTRLVQLIVVLLVVTFLTFLMVRFLPGDPVLSVTGCPETATEDPICADKIAQATEEPRPRRADPGGLPGTGSRDLLPPDVDLGFSYVRNTEVSELLGTAIPRTAPLMVYSIIVSLVIAIPLGVLAAYRQSTVDRPLHQHRRVRDDRRTELRDGGAPHLHLRHHSSDWFPARPASSTSSDGSYVEHFKSYILPVLALALRQAAVFTRLLRTDMVATLPEDFIGMAKAKGMPVRRDPPPPRPAAVELHAADRRRHQHRPADRRRGDHRVHLQHQRHGLASWPRAVQRSDYIVVQSGVVIVAIVFVILNFVVDFLYGVLDPRVRHARAH